MTWSRARAAVLSLPVGGAHERALAGEDAEDIGARRRLGEVARGGAEDEVDFLLQRARLQRRRGHGRVGGAEDELAMPRDGEEHAAVLRFRNEQRRVAGLKTPVDHEVNPLARREHRRRAGLVHPPDAVGKDAGRIDDGGGLEAELLARLRVARRDAAHAAVLLEQAGHGQVVERGAAARQERAEEGDREPRVVELAVDVEHAAAQSVAAERGQKAQRLEVIQQVAGAEAQPAGELLVREQAGAVIRLFPPAIGGDDEAEAMHEMRRIALEQAALVERFADEAEIPLREVAHAAVDELGRARGGPLRKVRALQQQRAIAARHRIDRRAEARRAAADHEHVPAPALPERSQQRGAGAHLAEHRGRRRPRQTVRICTQRRGARDSGTAIMKTFLLLLVIVIGAAYAYHWYSEQHAPPPPVEEATPTPAPRRATPTPQRNPLQTSGLQTHSLNSRGLGTPGSNANPLNAPHH